MLKTHLFLILLPLAVMQCSCELNYRLAGDFHNIPQQNGGFKIMSTQEVIEASENQPFIEPIDTVSFYLNTRLNPTEALIYTWDKIDDITNSTFNPDHPTRITIHGWINSALGTINTLIRDEYLKVGEFNVIAVDWSEIAGLDYTLARAGLPDVAVVIAQLIDRLAEMELLDVDDLSIIGHSLGAHLAGLVGKNIAIGHVGTIVGMDPAFWLFNLDNPEDRLDKDDAVYVEVIHTNDIITGFPYPIGDADFFPNGGETQPGCPNSECDHNIVFQFFAESVSTTVGFWASQCDNLDEIRQQQCTVVGPYVPMGGEPSNRDRAHGLYFLRTAENPPFALGLTFP